MSDNWIVGNLQNALETWNEKLEEIWTLVTATPQDFKGGLVWDVIVGINGSLKAVGYALLVLFFAMGVFQSAASFREIQRPEYAIRHFIRFAAAKVAVGYALDIMTTLFAICGSIVQTMMDRIGAMSAASVTMPQEIIDAIEDVGFLASIPLWLVSLLGSLFITVMSFVLILTVYSRFFKIYMYTALAPLPPCQLCRGGAVFYWQIVCQKLCRRVYGGRRCCAGVSHLHGLFRVGYFCGGHVHVCRHYGVELSICLCWWGLLKAPTTSYGRCSAYERAIGGEDDSRAAHYRPALVYAEQKHI